MKPDPAFVDGSGEARSPDLKDAYLDWLISRLGDSPALAATLTFQPTIAGQPISMETAKATLKMFRARLVSKIFPRRQRRKSSDGLLYFVAVIEGGRESIAKHIHAHVCIGVPTGMDPDDLMKMCERIWAGLKWGSKTQNVFEPCYDPPGWLRYLFKVRDKPSYSNAVDVASMSLKTRNS